MENDPSNRRISKSLEVSRPVTAQYITAFKKSGLSYQDIKEIDDESLLEILDVKPKGKATRYKALEQEFEHISKELKRTGVTLELSWEEYRKKHADGYSYTRFCFHYQVWRNGSELCMHMEHKAGDKMFADFTGKKMYITDRVSGIRKDVEVFVGLLGASRLTCVEGVTTRGKEDWIKVNEHALWYFGGVPQALVPDCLKSAVIKVDKYEPDINQEYYDFARYYNTVILPARVRHPKDKALVEGAVNIVYSWIFARLRDRTFYSLKELIEAVLQSKEHPEQGFKVCFGILNLSKKYGDFRLDRACKKALEWKYLSLKGIKNILENKLDTRQEAELFPESEIKYEGVSHSNIRGSGYFQQF